MRLELWGWSTPSSDPASRISDAFHFTREAMRGGRRIVKTFPAWHPAVYTRTACAPVRERVVYTSSPAVERQVIHESAAQRVFRGEISAHPF